MSQKSVPVKKQTHLHLLWPEGEYIFNTFFYFWENNYFRTIYALLNRISNADRVNVCLK